MIKSSRSDEPTAREDSMTTNQLGRRLDHVEQDVGSLKLEVAKTTAAVDGMRSDITIMFGKLDAVIGNSTNTTATRGMIPWQIVAWGIGLLTTLTGLGLTVTGVGASLVLYAMGQHADRDAMRMDFIEHYEEQRHELVASKMDLLDSQSKNTAGKTAELEAEIQDLEISFAKKDGILLNR